MAGVKGRSGGRNAKTLREHQLDGTIRPDRHGDGHACPDPPLGDPPKPDYLEGEALAEWDRTVERCRTNGTLAVTDDAAIENYVDAHVQWWRLKLERDVLPSVLWEKVTQSMDEAGNVSTFSEPRIHPVVGRIDTALKTKKLLQVELGLTPVSRSRVKVTAKDAKPEPTALERLQAESRQIRAVPTAAFGRSE